jgi:peptidoglycan hydrolase-like protein with peptidoglycan-binding domain
MTSDCTFYDELPEHEFEPSIQRVGRVPLNRGVARVGNAFRPRSSFACAIPGINLNDYSLSPSGKGWGRACQQAHTTITLSNGVRMTCASQIAVLSTLLWNEVLRRGYVLRSGVCGCYNCRYISGTTVWSNHAWALAFDINWDVNPYTTGFTHDIPNWVVQLANRYGFAWGGDYTGGRRDYMHFEFMGTPDQAVLATNLAVAELSGGQPVPIPTPIPTPAPDNTEQIKKDQFDLTDTGFPTGGIDGIWGPSSIAACRAFQAAAKLAVDGICGDNTRAALHKVPSWHSGGNIPDDPGGYPASQWQQKLKDHGWRIDVDNAWGAHSKSILSQFQADKGLTVDGLRGPASWTCLYCTSN